MNDPAVNITDVTLREYGQNIQQAHLDIFTPEIRSGIALRLIDAGFKSIEIFSCVNPSIAPAMREGELEKTLQAMGKIEGVNLITLIPNEAGFEKAVPPWARPRPKSR